MLNNILNNKSQIFLYTFKRDQENNKEKRNAFSKFPLRISDEEEKFFDWNVFGGFLIGSNFCLELVGEVLSGRQNEEGSHLRVDLR